MHINTAKEGKTLKNKPQCAKKYGHVTLVSSIIPEYFYMEMSLLAFFAGKIVAVIKM